MLKKFKKGMVSIIIPTYNRKRVVLSCVHHAMRQSYPNKEIIVVDDHSTDGTFEMLKKRFPKITLIRNDKNEGPSQSKNIGANHSKGEYLLFLDSDTQMDNRRAMGNMALFLRNNKNVGEVGGEKSPHDPSKVFGWEFVDAKRGWMESMYSDRRESVKQCGFVSTANCMMRHDVFIAIGGFDPYFYYPMEDADLGYRLIKKGYRNVLLFDGSATHLFSQVSRLNIGILYHRTIVRFVIKHFGFWKSMLLPISYTQRGTKKMVSFFLNKVFGMRKETRHHSSIPRPPLLKGMLDFAATPFYVARAYGWNILHLKMTQRSRQKDFLNHETKPSLRYP